MSLVAPDYTSEILKDKAALKTLNRQCHNHRHQEQQAS